VKKIITDIVNTVLADHMQTIGRDQKIDSTINTLSAQFVIDQIRRMPDYLYVPFLIVTYVFNICAVLFGGRVFTSLPLNKKINVFHSWEKSKFSFYRDFCKVYKSLTIFSFYSLESR
jgi:hypothetical protein